MALAFLNKHKSGFTKFVLVGGVSTTFNYALFYALHVFLNVNYLIASSTGYISGIFISYWLNKYYTFKSIEKATTKEIAKYYSVFIISLFIGLGFLSFLVEIIGLMPVYANILMIGFTVVLNYLGTHYFVFKKNLKTKRKR